MKARLILVITIGVSLAGCHSKKQEATAPCLGCYATQADAQADADRQNAARVDVTAKDKALGVHQEYLPCGHYQPAARSGGYWYVQEDRSGCPPTAGQLDPHPTPPEPAQSTPGSQPGGKEP